MNLRHFASLRWRLWLLAALLACFYETWIEFEAWACLARWRGSNLQEFIPIHWICQATSLMIDVHALLLVHTCDWYWLGCIMNWCACIATTICAFLSQKSKQARRESDEHKMIFDHTSSIPKSYTSILFNEYWWCMICHSICFIFHCAAHTSPRLHISEKRCSGNFLIKHARQSATQCMLKSSVGFALAMEFWRFSWLPKPRIPSLNMYVYKICAINLNMIQFAGSESKNMAGIFRRTCFSRMCRGTIRLRNAFRSPSSQHGTLASNGSIPNLSHDDDSSHCKVRDQTCTAGLHHCTVSTDHYNRQRFWQLPHKYSKYSCVSQDLNLMDNLTHDLERKVADQYHDTVREYSDI